jgi:hypothetical protein
MKTNRTILGALALLATGVAGFAAGRAVPQASFAPPLGEEHRWLASLAGEYTTRMGGMLGESDGTSRIETSLGGLWSVRHFEGELMGQPFDGMEVLGFDPLKEKFVSVWVDSVTPLLMTMEGTYDADTRTLTMRGLSRGMDGEEAEMVNTTVVRDGGMTWTMNIEGVPDPMMTIDFTRKR